MSSEVLHTTHEEQLVLPDGVEVYKCAWKPTSGAPVAYVLFLHGFSDHSHAYYDLFPSLATRGIEVHSFDQRGWGRSSLTQMLWGRTGTTKDIVHDIDYLLAPLFKHGKPVFLVGHSAGGGLALMYGHIGPQKGKLAGIIGEAPLVQLAPETAPNFIVEKLGKLAARLLPNQTMVQKLPKEYMSRDPEVNDAFANDDLCHDTGTLLGLSEMMDRMKYLHNSNGEGWPKEVPFVMYHGSADKVNAAPATRQFVERLKARGFDGEYVELGGWHHKLHADTKENRVVFAKLVGDWILNRAEKHCPAPN